MAAALDVAEQTQVLGVDVRAPLEARAQGRALAMVAFAISGSMVGWYGARSAPVRWAVMLPHTNVPKRAGLNLAQPWLGTGEWRRWTAVQHTGFDAADIGRAVQGEGG